MQAIKVGDKEVCIYCVLELFRRRGGDFVRILGQLWWQADATNKRKIVETWSNYFEEYAGYVLKERGRCRHDGAEV